jgi:hypothetical protein
MRKTEVALHSPEQIESYLRDALALVDALNVPTDLRPHAFLKAVELLQAKQVFFEQAAMLPDLGLAGRGH